jgi:hypothetical protein
MEDTDTEKHIIYEKSLSFELGDIIHILAPSNPDIHEMSYLITYIDDDKMVLINISNFKRYQLNILPNGYISDESITAIEILSSSKEKGYCRINHLLPNTWIDVHFGGEAPAVITGQITNLEEDMIEITTFPDLVVMYIDFEYKGIPEHIPIEKIVIRKPPASMNKQGSLASLKEKVEEGEIDNILQDSLLDNKATIEFTETGESIIDIPKDAEKDLNINNILEQEFIEGDAIVFGEMLEDITDIVEIPQGQQRYSIEVQVNDLMDELLSTIPNNQRTKIVMDDIHLLIERFKQLRELFSKFDNNKNISDFKKVGPLHKPLVDKLYNLDFKLKWVLPVVSNVKPGLFDEGAGIFDRRAIIDMYKTQMKYYKTKKTDQFSTYAALHNDYNSALKPFEQVNNPNKFITNKQVLEDIDTIIDNLGNYKSETIKPVNSTRRGFAYEKRITQFVVQRYNLGLTKMGEKVMKNGKKIYVRVPMIPNDKLTLKSLIMLPSSVIQFSKINLPMTSMLERSNLHNDFFMLFRALDSKTDIIPHTIENFENEINYEKIEADSSIKFLSKIEEYLLSDEIGDDEDKFQNMLNVIIPRTKLLIKVFQKYIKNKISFIDVVQALEPFMVYTNDISYKQYMEIRYFIKNKIIDIKKQFAEKAHKMSALRNAKYVVPLAINPIFNLIDAKKEFIDAFYENYKLLTKNKEKTNVSETEVLSYMNQLDNGNFFSHLLKSLLVDLATPDNLMNLLSKPNVDEMSDVEKIKPGDCVRRYLSKQYGSLKELQKDNHKDDVYYDKQFDDTPYDILKKYKEEQKKMLADEFIEYLAENLVQKHDCPPALSKDLAKTLIHGKKEVNNGDYAILEIKPVLPASVDVSTLSKKEQEEIENEADVRKKIEYYRRIKDVWTHDKEISEEAFIDTNTLFCNISSSCYKNTKNNICETLNQTEDRLKKQTREKLLGEFDKRYVVSVEELEKTLEYDIEFYRKRLIKLQILNDIQRHKANNLAFELGKLSNTEEIITSPYLKLRDLILSQEDFTKKQYDIVRFVDKFCRDPMIDHLSESPYWKYCIETNTKLIPSFLYKLAFTFITGGDYALAQIELCKEIGGDDDGDSIYDKHSGFSIRKIDYSTEEGYDEAGFRVKTHDIMEKDLGAMMIEQLTKKQDKVFENEKTEMIYNIYKTVCMNIDIDSNILEEFVLSKTNEIMNKAIKTEEKYREESELKEKNTGKPLEPFTEYYNKMIILITGAVILVGFQTAIPSFQNRKTFPGCVRSFNGYPLAGIEDMTSLKYMACVLDGSSKSKTNPWKSMKQLNPNTIVERMKVILEKSILKRTDIIELYLKKKEYLLLNPDIILNDEHSIQKWVHFLPPVVDYSIVKTTNNVSADFHKEFVNLLQEGKIIQHQNYNIIKSKSAQYGYAIIESINKIVKSKDEILMTSGLKPFMENACCNESNMVNPIRYFAKDNDNINVYLTTASKLGLVIKNVKDISRPFLFYHEGFTGIKYPAIPLGHLEENIYAAFIHYCNYDRNLPVPEKLKSLCSEKPPGYQSTWTIQEKTEFLKKNGKRYTVENLHQLMTIIAEQNVVHTSKPIVFTKVDILKDVLQNLDLQNTHIIDLSLRELLRGVLSTHDPTKMVHEATAELNNLKDHLYEQNNLLRETILQFLKKHGSKILKTNDLEKILNYISTIHSWLNSKEIKTYTDEEIYSFSQYIKNVIYSLTTVYPTMILNKHSIATHQIPFHWGFSKNDMEYILSMQDSYYSNMGTLHNDEVLNRLLLKISSNLENLQLFAKNIPIISPLEKDNIEYYSLFDKYTTISLFIHCFYVAINEYINLSKDNLLLVADNEQNKQTRRENIREEKYDVVNSAVENITDESFIEYNDELQEMTLERLDITDLSERVCKLLTIFLQIEDKNKKVINFSYDNIMHYVSRDKKKEKDKIVKFFGNMSEEERKVEDLMKNYRIGRWNVGQQKSLVKYNKKTNEREIDEAVEFLNQDIDEGGNVMTELMGDLYWLKKNPMNEISSNTIGKNVNELEQEEQQEYNEEANAEGYDITELGEDYEDGDYYNEDDEF